MSKVDEFMEQLGNSIPTAKNFTKEKSRKIEKISLNFGGNEGRYQILPVDSAITGFPFVVLTKTREICIPRKNVSADGKEEQYEAWIKLLPKNGYQMKDSEGRIVSSLTSEEEALMKQANELFDQLYTEIDGKNNLDVARNLCRYRNYTLFHAMCLNMWSFQDSRKPTRQNFSGLFVSTAKGFMQAVSDNIEEKCLMTGGDKSWLQDIYTDKLSGRKGYMLFSISRSKTTPGYTVTVNHEVNPSIVENVVIADEDAELMQDPVASFLGWQANHDEETPIGQRRLFNASLYKEAIAFMTQQLAAVRVANNSGANIVDAIETTNRQILEESKPTTTMGEAMTDPMLASMTQNATQSQVNMEKVVENNQTPFNNPPAAQMDPVQSAPVSSNSPFGNTSTFSGGASFSNPFGGGTSFGA